MNILMIIHWHLINEIILLYIHFRKTVMKQGMEYDATLQLAEDIGLTNYTQLPVYENSPIKSNNRIRQGDINAVISKLRHMKQYSYFEKSSTFKPRQQSKTHHNFRINESISSHKNNPSIQLGSLSSYNFEQSHMSFKNSFKQRRPNTTPIKIRHKIRHDPAKSTGFCKSSVKQQRSARLYDSAGFAKPTSTWHSREQKVQKKSRKNEDIESERKSVVMTDREKRQLLQNLSYNGVGNSNLLIWGNQLKNPQESKRSKKNKVKLKFNGHNKFFQFF